MISPPGQPRRWWACLLLAGPVSGCQASDPPIEDPFVGRWLLETVNSQTLPAIGQEIGNGQHPVVGGRLVINEPGRGFPRWEYCTEPPSGRSFGSLDIRYGPGDPTQLIIIFPLSAPVDTLTMVGDVLIWEYNLHSAPGYGSSCTNCGGFAESRDIPAIH